MANELSQRDLDTRRKALIDESVGENLDQLATLDMRGDGMLRLLYRVARDLTGEPLSLAAARQLTACCSPGRHAVVLTGFLSPRDFPETDGLIGSAVLASTLERCQGVLPVCVCETEVAEPLAAAMRASGLNVTSDLEAHSVPHPIVILEYPREVASARRRSAELSSTIDPAICIAIERPGANPKGEYHWALGKNVTHDVAPIDFLYRELQEHGAPTLAIGDFGNELGMGRIYDAVRRETPTGADCGCGCDGGTACATVADVTVLSSTSDWGAYAVAACVAYIAGDLEALPDTAVYRRIVEDTVRAGAIDGPTRYADCRIDGIDLDVNCGLMDLMRNSIKYISTRSTHSAILDFRAQRS